MARAASTPRKRVPRGALDRAKVVRAAVELADEHGLSSLTVRAVADRLGCGPMALYRHVADMDELVELVVAEIVDRKLAPLPRTTDWERYLRAYARQLRTVLLSDPAILAANLRTPILSRSTLASAERLLSLLERAGLSAQQTVGIYDLFMLYVVGYAALSHGRAAGRVARHADVDEDRARIRNLLDGLPAQSYPALAALAPWMSGLHDEEQFERGLQMIVASVRALIVVGD